MQPHRSPGTLPSAGPEARPLHSVVGKSGTILSLSDVQHLLAGKNQQGRLIALADGDPLGLIQGSRRWLVHACLLFDVQPFVERARVALSWDHARFNKLEGTDSVPLEYWLSGVYRRTADVLHARDQELDETGQTVGEPLSPRFQFLRAVLGIDHGDLRSACIVANALPDRERVAFHQLLVQGRTLDDFVRLGNVSRSEARRALQLAVKTIGRARAWADQGARASMEQA
ncbi:MAG TPA: hypothetical protein EYQ74_12815 [Planctomycetes bacterium]|nr:hypothetical protein [Planctomycetota bacterium]